MIDQLRSDIQQRLNQLLAEADKLRRALAALGSHDGDAASREAPATRSASRARTAGKRSAATSARATPRSSARSTSATAPQTRAASGATRSAVLSALANGNAMTAGEVARATGLGRASVSTTLSKLAKSGEVTKADRGYRLGERSKSSS
jgi:DNA-binding transcriptional ArsR family regulator